MLTLEDIAAIPKTMLTPADVCSYTGGDPQMLRHQAHKEPQKLGFPVICIGSHVKIPKEGFINYCKYGRREGEGNEGNQRV